MMEINVWSFSALLGGIFLDGLCIVYHDASLMLWFDLNEEIYSI